MRALVLRQAGRIVPPRFRSPAFTVPAVASLALSLGLAAGIGSVLNAFVLRRLPVSEPDRLVSVSRIDPRGQSRWMPVATVDALATDARAFDAVCGYAAGGLMTTEPRGVPVQGPFEFVTGACYEMFGVRPLVGRLIAPQDAPLAGPPAHVAVLGYGFWQAQFSGDPGVVGRTLRVEGIPLTVIGVTPPGFSGLQVDYAPAVTVPATLLPALGIGKATSPQVNYLVGRLARGVTLDQARARVNSAWPAVRTATAPPDLAPKPRADFQASGIRLAPLATGFSFLRDDYARPLYLLTGLALLLLGLTATNVSSLLLLRSITRQRELAVRSALGAGRLRLAGHVAADGLAVGVLGLAAGIPVAFGVARLAAVVMRRDLADFGVSLDPDLRVLAAAAAAALLVSIALALVPAIVVARGNPVTWLKDGDGRAAPGRRPGRLLLVAEIAAAVVLVSTAVVFARSLSALDANPRGFDGHQLYLARLFPLPERAAAQPAPAYYPDLVRGVASLPGIESASLSRLFLGITDAAEVMTPISRADAAPGSQESLAVVDAAAPGFFATARIPLLQGRDFSWSDDEASGRVAIVNRAAARQLAGPGNAVGLRVRIGSDPALQDVEIVGVVDDSMIGDARAPHVPVMTRPSLQWPRMARYSFIVFRSPLAVSETRRLVGDLVRSRGYDFVSDVRPADAWLGRSLVKDRGLRTASLAFAGLAVLIAFVGTYAILSLAVSRRRRELGVRAALGATRGRLVRSVVAEGAWMTASGVIVGVPCAVAAARLSRSLLFGVEPGDPVTYVMAGLVLAAACALAVVRPAWRASVSDPLEMLRSE